MKNIKREMKTVYTLALLILALAGFSQTAPPNQVNYQGIARSVNGTPIINRSIGLKFEIFQGAATTPTYSEVQNVTSNALGLFSTQIGKVTSLGSIDWANGPYFLLVSMDTTGGTTYISIGNSQQINSVPYALYAGSAGSVPVSSANNVLTIGTQTVALNSSGTSPSLTITGNILGISGGNSVPIPTTQITGSGGTTVTPIPNGFDIDTAPSMTLTGGTTVGGFPVPPGLLQIMGSSPNYSIIVTPTISYSQVTGSLNLSNIPGTSPPYSYNFYITPAPALTGNLLSIGPLANNVDFNPISPWRWNQAANQVTLATNSPTQAIGINTVNPLCALDVNGYTKLGPLAPQIQVAKYTGTTPNAQNNSVTIFFALPNNTTNPIIQNKIIGVSVLVDAGTGVGNLDWIPPRYITTAGFEYNWRITNGGVVIETANGNSANILGKAVRILITYEQ